MATKYYLYYVEGEDFVFPNIPVRDGYTGIWNYDESDITGDKIIEVIVIF